MDATRIIELIRIRHQEFWDRQIGASTSDFDNGAAAQRARDIADEYEDLLSEIERQASFEQAVKK